jgi:hypothetical protein
LSREASPKHEQLTAHLPAIAFARATATGVILFITLLAPKPLLAKSLQIPLHISYPLMSSVLKHRLNGHDGKAQLWNGTNDCEYLYGENPSFGQQGGTLRVETRGHLNLGVPVGDRCLSPITWSGIIEANTRPYVAGFAVKLHVTDLNLYDRDHKKSLLVGRGFDLIKRSFIPLLETYSFDLTPAIQELDTLARMAALPEHQAALHLALASMRLEPRIIVEPAGIQLTMTIELPRKVMGTPAGGSTAPLTPGEIAAWNNALDNWDAFLVFAIKQIGATVSDRGVRNELFEILLDSRERLIGALGQPQGVKGPDPVRLLFLQEWTRLGQVIEKAASQGALGNRSLEFLSFISAGDALFALDQAGSDLGLRISAADLRRLARIIAPQSTEDPLAYSFDEDPQLRQMFGLTAPLEEPDVTEPSTGGAAATPYPPTGEPTLPRSDPNGASTRAPSPSRPFGPTVASMTPVAASVSLTRAISSSRRSSWFVIGAPVAFADEVSGTGQTPLEILTLGSKLRGVVVNRENAVTYRNEVDRLLDLTAHYQLENDADEPFDPYLWPTLLKATAWQESCWRQYVIKHGRTWFLESKSGDIGLMQVNKYIWRGFYNLARLQWDLVYNVGAGSAILHRLLGGASDHLKTHDSAVLARAAYAAYNGGPGAYDRWRQAHEPEALRQTDQAFWFKYQAIASRQSFDILSCASQWDRHNAD